MNPAPPPQANHPTIKAARRSEPEEGDSRNNASSQWLVWGLSILKGSQESMGLEVKGHEESAIFMDTKGKCGKEK